MKFLIAPDKFKGSMDALTAARVMKSAILEQFPNAETVCMPLADGGEGSLQVFQQMNQYEEVIETVQDPLGRPKKASYLFDSENQSAIIEMAQASGLLCLEMHERNPMKTSTFGMGQQIKSAIGKGAKKILLCIGGSATNDCGMGMAAALGYQFLDERGELLAPIGKNMSRVVEVENKNVVPRLCDVVFEVACDVTNPLFGQNGAAHIYGPQKGANVQQVDFLDKGLEHLSGIIERDLGKDVSEIIGGGAAGGIGAGTVAFLNAKLLPGAQLMLDAIDFDEQLALADWVFTGEGKIDQTSFQGKLLSEISRRNETHNKSIAAFAGRVEGMEHLKPRNIYFNEISPRDLQLVDALRRGKELLNKSVKEFLVEVVK